MFPINEMMNTRHWAFIPSAKTRLQTRVVPNPGEKPGCWLKLLNPHKVEATRLIYSFSLVLLQCLLLALYRIVLPVLILSETVKICKAGISPTTI